MARCPICGRPAPGRAENAAFPFCTPRCRQIDLGAWFDEKYRVPLTDGEGDESSDGMGDGASRGDEG